MALEIITDDKRVRQRAFEPVADLDADLVLVRRDKKEHAVVLLRLPELPGAEQLVGISLDVAALQRFYRGDDELDAGFVFEILQLGLKSLRLCGVMTLA